MRPFRKRDLALMKAERFIVESGVSVITIPELCMVANVSERTLEYAFRERYGLTPKAYTLIHRMNNIHKYLRRADPQNTLISEIARQYGFWHMGKFSADYKKIFGELPSETLKYT
jgi:AraC family ethanolamine operon transcriptional activator